MIPHVNPAAPDAWLDADGGEIALRTVLAGNGRLPLFKGFLVVFVDRHQPTIGTGVWTFGLS